MKYENIFREFGKKIDKIVEKAPEFYQEKIEKPAKEFFNGIEKKVEKFEISIPIKGEVKVPIDLETIPNDKIRVEIVEKDSMINIILQGEEDKVIRQIIYPKSVDISDSEIEFDKHYLIIINKYKEEPIGTEDKFIQIVYL